MALGNTPAFPPCVCELRTYSEMNSNAGILGEKTRVDLSQLYLELFTLGYIASKTDLGCNWNKCN